MLNISKPQQIDNQQISRAEHLVLSITLCLTKLVVHWNATIFLVGSLVAWLVQLLDLGGPHGEGVALIALLVIVLLGPVGTATIIRVQIKRLHKQLKLTTKPTRNTAWRYMAISIALAVAIWLFLIIFINDYTSGNVFFITCATLSFIPCVLMFNLNRKIMSQIQPGYCIKCHYDMRGSLAADRFNCPECGHAYRKSH